MKLPSFAEINKALSALGATLLVATGAGLITGQTAVWASGLIASAVAFVAVYLSPKNAPPAVPPPTP